MREKFAITNCRTNSVVLFSGLSFVTKTTTAVAPTMKNSHKTNRYRKCGIAQHSNGRNEQNYKKTRNILHAQHRKYYIFFKWKIYIERTFSLCFMFSIIVLTLICSILSLSSLQTHQKSGRETEKTVVDSIGFYFGCFSLGKNMLPVSIFSLNLHFIVGYVQDFV